MPGCGASTGQHNAQRNALRSDAEALLEAFVGMGAGDDLRARAAYIHIPLTLDDVTGITLQPVNL